jgi:hypothetical protein
VHDILFLCPPPLPHSSMPHLPVRPCDPATLSSVPRFTHGGNHVTVAEWANRRVSVFTTQGVLAAPPSCPPTPSTGA